MPNPMDTIFLQISQEYENTSHDDLNYVDAYDYLFFIKSPTITDELFTFIQKNMGKAWIENIFVRYHKRKNELELKDIVEKSNSFPENDARRKFYVLQIPDLEALQNISSIDEYIKHLNNLLNDHPDHLDYYYRTYKSLNKEDDTEDYIKNNYHLYKVGKILYRRYSEKMNQFKQFERPCADHLRKHYLEYGIEIDNEDSQFSKYGLLSLNQSLEIHNSHDHQVLYDRNSEKYFWINVPRPVLSAIEHTLRMGWVNNISFFVNSITDWVPAMEALQFGRLFNFDALALPKISKLYNDSCYEDSMWIMATDKPPASLTFEELCSDENMLDGFVKTQVVHLEFLLENDQYFITHLDHEYILYNIEEYEKRKKNCAIKGQKKQKTFKIDNSRIPFEFNFDRQYFLYTLLDCHFENKNIIKDYFSEINE